MAQDNQAQATASVAKAVSEEEMMSRFFNQISEMYIFPEVESRRKKGLINDSFRVSSFQVIMNVGKTNEVRLNEEVKIAALVKIKEGRKEFREGDLLGIDDVEQFQDFMLTKADENAGHVTAMQIKGAWNIRYNFKYNTQRRREFLNTAKEFLNAAQFSLKEKQYRSMHENLFAAMEAGVIVTLISLPNESYLSMKKHTGWHSEINKWNKAGNIKADYVALYNKLLNKRNDARYSDGQFIIRDEDAQKMCADAAQFLSELEKTIPTISNG